eukprot:2551087-Lingulodinium_polyedra.AAC.1
MGLDSLVDFILRIKGKNEMRLPGYSKITADLNQEFALVVALASRVSDSVLQMILEDNRAGLQ